MRSVKIVAIAFLQTMLMIVFANAADVSDFYYFDASEAVGQRGEIVRVKELQRPTRTVPASACRIDGGAPIVGNGVWGSAPIALVGDFNVMPTDLDVYKPERWRDDALFRPEVNAERSLSRVGRTRCGTFIPMGGSTHSGSIFETPLPATRDFASTIFS